MNPTGKLAIGIDLGGSSIKAVVVQEDGTKLGQKNVPFDPAESLDWAGKIRDILAQLEQEASIKFSQSKNERPRIGLSAPGLAAAEGKSIACMPGRLQGLEGLNWAEFLKSPQPVPVLNDAHAALLGEAWLGAARGFQHVIMLTLGTGVGGAALVEGRLLRGWTGRGGHLGHTCLNPQGTPDITRMPGSLEDAIGNCTIEARTGGKFNSTHDLVSAHRAGDAQASEIWLKSIRDLACAIGSFINILDPEAVIVGGGIARSGAALFEPLQAELDKVEWRPAGTKAKILPAQLGEYAGAYGAAKNAWDDAVR